MIDRIFDVLEAVLVGVLVAVAGTVTIYIVADLILTWAERTP